MGQDTKIEWAHHTFNPWIGCQKVSPGCANCYAEEMMDHRYGKAKWGPEGTRVLTSDSNWKQPIKWNKESIAAGVRHQVFCASLADVFEDRQDLVEWRHRLMDTIYLTPGLDWLLLTKRPEIAYYWSEKWPFHKNVWIGTSVENQEYADERIPWLLRVKAAKRFLSMEPLLGPVSIMKTMLDRNSEIIAGKEWTDYLQWVIVGGESGNKARLMEIDWVDRIRAECKDMKVPFFFKQWGEWCPFCQSIATTPVDGTMFLSTSVNQNNITYFKVGKRYAGRLLNGQEWNEVPDGLFVKATCIPWPDPSRWSRPDIEAFLSTPTAGDTKQAGG